jgi:hypothetical protein
MEALEEDAGGERADVEEGRSFFTSVVLTVNMVLGAGVVGLPYAFFHAGAWLSLVCMITATLMSTGSHWRGRACAGCAQRGCVLNRTCACRRCAATMGYIVETSAWARLYLSDEARAGESAGAAEDDEHAASRSPDLPLEEGGSSAPQSTAAAAEAEAGEQEAGVLWERVERRAGFARNESVETMSEMCGIFLSTPARRFLEVGFPVMMITVRSCRCAMQRTALFSCWQGALWACPLR